MNELFYQATIYLTAAVVAVPLATRLGLGSVLGYLIAGLMIGPVLGMVGAEAEDLRHYFEFGVVMMLFLIGLELTPRSLWEMRDILLGLGGLQIGLTTGAFLLAGLSMGLSFNHALAFGLIFALSSTAIVLQTLSEKGLMKTPGGKATFSVLLTQDIAVIPMLAVLPLLAMSAPPQDASSGTQDHSTDGGHHGGGHHGAELSLIEGLAGWQVALVTLLAVGAIILTGIYLTRPVFRYIHMAKLREMATITALLIVIAIAFLMSLVGLSPALGAFLAGVVLANSEFRHELEASLEPFKGLLLGLFFITVGAGVDFAFLGRNLWLALGLTLGLMTVKGAILYGLALAFRIRGRDKWLFTLGLAQAGEFGFVLTSFALGQNVLPDRYADLAMVVIALSMLLTPLFFIAYEYLSKHIGPDDVTPDGKVEDIEPEGSVIIAGIGRFGQVVMRMVRVAGLRTTVLDHDLKAIEMMRRQGFKSFLGDPTRPELLHAAGLGNARVLVAALDDRDSNTKLVRYARENRPELHIIARAYDRVHVYELYRAGADDIVREMFDSSLRAGRYVLENMDFSPFEASEVEKAFYRHDRRTLRELADVWKPGVQVSENPDYLHRSRELNEELDATLFAIFEEDDEDEDAGVTPETAARARVTRSRDS